MAEALRREKPLRAFVAGRDVGQDPAGMQAPELSERSLAVALGPDVP